MGLDDQHPPWLAFSTPVLCMLPPLQVPSGPSIQDNSSGKKSQNRTWTDLLKDDHDGDLFDFCGSSELLMLDVRPDSSGKEQQPVLLGPTRMYTE